MSTTAKYPKPDVPPERPSRRAVPLAALLAPLAALLIVGAAAGGFYAGQGTRQSPEAVAEDRAAAARAAERATADAVEAKGAADEAATDAAEQKLKARNLVVLRRALKKQREAAEKKAERAFANGQSTGFTNGQSAGFENGREVGEEDGMRKASDELTCSDDVDVALPFC